MQDLEGLTTAAVADAVVRHGLALRLGPAGLLPVIPGSVVAGRVRRLAPVATRGAAATT